MTTSAASHPADLVLDPFCGSATTLVAARQLGRASAGFEINSDYVGLAAKRLHG